MFNGALSPWHLFLVIVVAVLVFGSKKLPEVARGLGQSMRILKAETKAMKEDGKTDTSTAASTASSTTASTASSTTTTAASPQPAVEPGPSASSTAADQSEKTTARTEKADSQEAEQRTS